MVIAAALACEPRILIADEPTTSLDVTVQKHILDLLDDLRAERGMSMILVTHDLGVVKGRTDEVMVMYAGRTMEEAPTEEIFSQQGHPYTEALIETIPKINSASHTRLVPIPGQPPVTTSPPTGCPFADRCRYTTDRCVTQGPPLTPLGDDHQVACHTPVGTPAAAAALAANRRGSNMRMLWSGASQSLSNNASGTLVVLPVPGGAVKTAAAPGVASASVNAATAAGKIARSRPSSRSPRLAFHFILSVAAAAMSVAMATVAPSRAAAAAAAAACATLE